VRIIAGEFRSRKLSVVGGFVTRPMPDRVRESIFGMLGTRAENATVLDLFAGSGAIGLEALSRGAKSCLFVERDRGAAEVLERNIQVLKVESRTQLVVGDALGMSVPARSPRPVDLVFMDPPYPLVLEPVGWERVKEQGAHLGALLADDGFLVLRTPWPFVLDAPAAAPAVEGEDAAAVPPPRALKRKKYRRPRERWEDDPFAESFQQMRPAGSRRGTPAPAPAPAQAETEAETEAEDEIDESAVSVTPGPEDAPIGPRAIADLSIKGCKGPETHVYGKTAVHWYMRAQ
jgi:16S rRNA (guanine966-N2)-methyltransferase